MPVRGLELVFLWDSVDPSFCIRGDVTHSLSLVTSFSTAEEFPTEDFMETGTFLEGKK